MYNHRLPDTYRRRGGAVQEHLYGCLANHQHPEQGRSINFYLAHDEARHVCELQLFHKKMFLARHGMDGHAMYGSYRSALELLQWTDFRDRVAPDRSFSQAVISVQDNLLAVGAHERLQGSDAATKSA